MRRKKVFRRQLRSVIFHPHQCCRGGLLPILISPFVRPKSSNWHQLWPDWATENKLLKPILNRVWNGSHAQYIKKKLRGWRACESLKWFIELERGSHISTYLEYKHPISRHRCVIIINHIVNWPQLRSEICIYRLSWH